MKLIEIEMAVGPAETRPPVSTIDVVILSEDPVFCKVICVTSSVVTSTTSLKTSLRISSWRSTVKSVISGSVVSGVTN